MNEISTPSEEDLQAFLQEMKKKEPSVAKIFQTYCEPTQKNIDLSTKISTAPKEALDLLKSMLHFIPSKRIDAENALLHKYFQMYLPKKDE